MKSLYLIDGHALLYQSFYAIGAMTGPRGEPTNAVYGFMSTLLKIIREKSPACVVVAFDDKEPTFRHDVFREYKAQRKPVPPDLVAQIQPTRELLQAMGIPTYSAPGYEADDVIGTIVAQAERELDEVVIVTRDKDARQLLSERTRIYDSRQDTYLDAKALQDEDAITSAQVPDLMALSGDATDNIPGVPGVGPKTALALIQKYRDLEAVLAAASDMPPSKRRQALIDYADQARLSLKLVTIDRNVPLTADLTPFRFDCMDRGRLFDIFSRLGFKRFMEELASPEREDAAGARRNYRAVRSCVDLAELVEVLRRAPRISVDLETTDPNPVAAQIVGLSFAWKEREAVYVPVRCALEKDLLDLDVVLDALRPVLESEDVPKTGQNLKYDFIVLGNYGVELRGIVFDTMLASYLLAPGRRRHNIDNLAMEFLHLKKIPTEDLLGKGKNVRRMDEVPLDAVTEYACEDADVALRLTNVLEPEIEKAELGGLLREVEIPLLTCLARMEAAGVALDAAYLGELSQRLHERLEDLRGRIHEMAGKPFNIDSPKQLAGVLFRDLGLPPVRRTKTGFSTDSSVLEVLARRHELPRLIVQYRQIAKLLGTYVDALPKMIVPKTGRVHTSFNQTVTATGRLSSSDPNLQNIPVRTEVGREIRRAFVPGAPGRVLLTADYSQIELRVLAHLSRDSSLLRAFRNDEDIHAAVAAEIFGVDLSDVTAEMRSRAKAVNFGIIYGQTAFGLSQAIGIDIEEAEDFIGRYFARYAGVADFITRTLAAVARDGFVTTFLNRRRYITGISEERSRNLTLPERTAVNTVVQGSAADLIKVAMIRIDGRLRKEDRPSRMILQIHDELVFEIPASDVGPEREMIAHEMSHAAELLVPLKVDVAFGDNWLEAK
ncbi:MAG: DNA polymerase I [Planctomycetota bacterium]